MYSCTREARTQVITAFSSHWSGKGTSRMAGDLDRFVVDGGLGQLLEYLKAKNVFVDHSKRGWHSRSTSTKVNVRGVSP